MLLDFFEKLFRNPGKKFRILANVVFCIYLLAGIVLGLIGLGDEETIILILIGPVAGFIVGWLNALFLHLFASIAENLYYINKNTSSLTNNSDQNNN